MIDRSASSPDISVVVPGHDESGAAVPLAREIAENPKLIIVVYPARGLDVGATESIHKLLMELRDSGTSILLISEDLDELMKLSDRVGVMFGGRIVGNFAIEEVDLEEVGLLMMGLFRSREERIHGDGH